MAFTITKITAFVATDENNEEGVMAFNVGNVWTPLVCADEKRIKQMLPIAEQISKAANKPYRIIQFTGREDVTEEIKKML